MATAGFIAGWNFSALSLAVITRRECSARVAEVSGFFVHPRKLPKQGADRGRPDHAAEAARRRPRAQPRCASASAAQALDPSSAQADGSQVKPPRCHATGPQRCAALGLNAATRSLGTQPAAGCSFGCLRAGYGFSRPLLTKNSFTGRSRAADTFA